MKAPFKIVHAREPILFACGFYYLERAEAWIEDFDPQMYTDKSLRKEDLCIVEERYTPRSPRRTKGK